MDQESGSPKPSLQEGPARALSEFKQHPYLADQQFVLSPEHPAAEEEGVTPVDLEIVAATYRSIVDQDAFEEMVANWEAKLSPARTDPGHRPRISKQMFGQLMMARNILEKLDIPVGDDPLRRAISEVTGPAIVLSPDGRVAISNVEGERAFDTRQGAFLDDERVAPASMPDFMALKRSATERGNAAQAILTILPPSTEAAYPEPFVAEAYLLDVPGQSSSNIAIRSLEVTWSSGVSGRLQQAFGLSAAESEVARQFFQLRNIDRIAHERKVSRLTVRTQIKSIMTKTGSPSNVDLMRLLAMVASRELVGKRGRTPVWNDPLQREQRIVTPDGRVVAWTWMGAEDGLPVIMLRGFPMTYLLPDQGEEKLKQAGIRLYALSSPGYGNSSLHTDLDPLEDELQALRAFLDRQIAGPSVGVGLSQGLMPLLAEQNANPARFRSLIAVGYTGVLDRSGVCRLPLIQRTMMQLASAAPWVVEIIAKTGHRQMREHGVDWYLERAYRTRPLDMLTYRDPNRAAMIRNACEHLLKQGHAAFVRGLQLALAPIDHVIEELTVPLVFLAPTEDGMFDEASYRLVEKRNPLISVEPVPEAGELIFYQKTDVILDHIIAAARGNAS